MGTEDFITSVRRALDQAERELEPGVSTRLARARRQALSADKPPRAYNWFPLAPALVAASIALVLSTVIWFTIPREIPIMQAKTSLPNMEELDLLTTRDNPEFYVELDFYHWLAAEIDAV